MTNSPWILVASVHKCTPEEFAANKHLNLFIGHERCQRPRCTAEARSSGLFQVFGFMVAHSIAQVGTGFPYFSPTCYWYTADGEEWPLEYVSTMNVGADVASVIRKVCSSIYMQY